MTDIIEEFKDSLTQLEEQLSANIDPTQLQEEREKMEEQTNENQQQKTPSENTETQNNQHQQPLTLLSPKTGTASSSPNKKCVNSY